MLKIEERSHWIGEFLSAPLSPGEADFDLSILGVPERAPYQLFFNICVWDSINAFEEQVVRPYVGAIPEPPGIRVRVSLEDGAFAIILAARRVDATFYGSLRVNS